MTSIVCACMYNNPQLNCRDSLPQSVIGHSEDDELAVDDNPTKAYEVHEPLSSLPDDST